MIAVAEFPPVESRHWKLDKTLDAIYSLDETNFNIYNRI